MFRTNGTLLRRLIKVTRPYWTSQQRLQALGLLGLVLLLLAIYTGINVGLSFVGARFMTAIASRDSAAFYHYIGVYLLCFACAVPIVVMFFYFQDLLALRWRDWLTKHILARYFSNGAYYHINNDASIDNPDERIAQDVREFTRFAVSFFLTLVGSAISVCSFASILWTISPLLVFIVIGYATVGTAVTLMLGRRLVGLNFTQSQREADLRYNLVQVRNNRESIAFYQGDKQEHGRILDRVNSVISNFWAVIRWQRNMGFFKSSYDYLVMLIPTLVIAPMFFAHKVEFGTITQAADAFNQVLVALSVVVAQYRVFSEFLAQVDRVGELMEKLDTIEKAAAAKTTSGTDAQNRITVLPADATVGSRGALLSCKGLTVVTPDGRRQLVQDLDVQVDENDSLLIMGPSGCGKSSLLRAIAGLWNSGCGVIRRPPLADMMFLPQRPYMVIGSLRAQLAYPSDEFAFGDSQLESALQQVGLSEVVDRVGGLNAVLQWDNTLSLGEQQRLSFARLLLHRSQFAVLDEATSALDAANEERLYRLLAATGTSYVSVGHRESLRAFHRKLLQLEGAGTWRVETTAVAPKP